MLELKNVSGTEKKSCLKDISFELPAGYILGITGENGAGKTTLLRTIFGEKTYTGTILLQGTDVSSMGAKRKERMALVSEEAEFFRDRSVLTNGDMLGGLYEHWDAELFHTTLRRMELPVRNALRNLSRGEFMKFQIAFAMAHHASLYLLDEVTAGMDPVFRMEFYQILREIVRDETASVILTTHMADEAKRNLDYIVGMKGGCLENFAENWQV